MPVLLYEPLCEKTGYRAFRPGPTPADLRLCFRICTKTGFFHMRKAHMIFVLEWGSEYDMLKSAPGCP